MGNIAYQKAFRKQQKMSYKGLTKQQKEYIKAKESFEQCDKDLNRFYRTAKRNVNGMVDFENMEKSELDFFDYLNRTKDKAMIKMIKLEGIIDVDKTLNIFLQINTHSMSF